MKYPKTDQIIVTHKSTQQYNHQRGYSDSKFNCFVEALPSVLGN